MAILKGIIMAINANDNGHTANDSCHKWQIRMAIIAIIMAIIMAINANDNGHKWQTANCHYGNNNGH